MFGLAILGLISGVISSFLIGFGVVGFLVPGVLFGIAISFYFWSSVKASRIVNFILLSGFAYFAAFYVVANSSNPLHGAGSDSSLVFIFAGLIGALILVLGMDVFLLRLTRKQFIILVFLGGLFVIPGIFTPFYGQLHGLYIVWQTGMAFALGICVRQNKKTVQIIPIDQ